MASFGHIAVGIAAAHAARAEAGPPRRSLGAIAFWSALSFLPDADVVGFTLGVPYDAEWGHRGASHSLVFAIVVGTAVGIAAAFQRRPAIRTGLVAIAVLVSHALLDTLTDGGLGCALLWPFDLTRYFAPWRPIPVAPIGFAYFSPYGLYVAATELLLFAPLLWIMRRRVSIPMLGIWAVALWLLLSGDPTRERIVRAVLQDTTEYAPRFAESSLDAVEQRDTKQQVRDRLGAPFREIAVGAESVCWVYSRSPDGGSFRARGVCFTGGRVAAVVRRWMRE